EKVNTNMLSNMYEEIGQMIEENEEEDAETEHPRLNYPDVEHILTSRGVEDVDPDKVKETLKTVFDNEQHEFKADSLVPKKVKINKEIAKLSIEPHNLKNVKYNNYEGRRCLLLEIEDDVEIEGFQLESASNNR